MASLSTSRSATLQRRRRVGRTPIIIPEKNAAPSQWARRLARAVGAEFGVKMALNHAKNEGVFGRRNIVIKCAKSPAPPVSVLVTMLERLDELWAVFVLPSGEAEVWRVPISRVREAGYFTRARDATQRVEITRRKIIQHGELLGVMQADAVEACQIP